MARMNPSVRVLCAVVLFCASSAFAAAPFAEGMVSITLDDGWSTQYTIARPALKARGIRSTYFLVTDAVAQGWGGYMSLAQVRTLHAENNEIASHTRTHADLTSLTPTQLTSELHDSRAWLAANVGAACGQALASPYGAYNPAVMTALKSEYASHRTINAGRNYRDTVIYELRANDVSRYVTVATVKGWIDQAIAEKSWLIILFHEFASTPTRETQYKTSNFTAILDYLKLRNVRTVTLSEGVALMDGLTDPPASAGTVVYDDAMGSGFQDWSWATHSLDESVTVHSGPNSLSFEPDYWEALMLHHTSGLELSLYQSIDLWVHGGTTGGQQVRLALFNDATPLGSVNLADVLGHPIAAGTWEKVSIPLSTLGATSGIVNDIYVQDDSGADQGTVYVDDFVLVPH